MKAEGGLSLLYFGFTSVLSLPRFENDAAPKEDETNPPLPSSHAVPKGQNYKSLCPVLDQIGSKIDENLYFKYFLSSLGKSAVYLSFPKFDFLKFILILQEKEIKPNTLSLCWLLERREKE